MKNQIIRIQGRTGSLAGLNPGYRSDVQLFRSWAKGRNLDLETIKEYLAGKEKAGMKNSSLARIRVSLKAFTLLSAGEKRHNKVFQAYVDQVFKDVKTFKADKTIKKDQVLTRAEVEKLIEGATKRISHVIKFLWITGLRIAELISITLKNCERLDERIIQVRVQGKGKKERFVKIPAMFFNELKAFYQGRVYLFETTGHKKFIQQNLYKEIRRTGKKVLKKDVHPHLFRHSFITYLLGAGKNVVGLSRYVGHSKPSITTDMYCHNELGYDDLFTINGELG